MTHTVQTTEAARHTPGPAVTERYLKSRKLLLGYLRNARNPHVRWWKPEDRTTQIKHYQQHLAIIRQQELTLS